jgi:hypothetical protein
MKKNKNLELLKNFREGRVSKTELKKAIQAPVHNPIVLINPANPSGELSDSDKCGMFGSKIFEPWFYEGMTYAKYKRRCQENPHDST